MDLRTVYKTPNTDVIGPITSTDNYVVLWNGTNGTTLKNGTAQISIDGTFLADSDAKLPTEKAIKTYIDSGRGDVIPVQYGGVTGSIVEV